jgi:hypothetical protein
MLKQVYAAVEATGLQVLVAVVPVVQAAMVAAVRQWDRVEAADLRVEQRHLVGPQAVRLLVLVHLEVAEDLPVAVVECAKHVVDRLVQADQLVQADHLVR